MNWSRLPRPDAREVFGLLGFTLLTVGIGVLVGIAIALIVAGVILLYVALFWTPPMIVASAAPPTQKERE